MGLILILVHLDILLSAKEDVNSNQVISKLPKSFMIPIIETPLPYCLGDGEHPNRRTPLSVAFFLHVTSLAIF